MNVIIETRAVKALADWKAQFADEVAMQAKSLAAKGDTPLRVTLHDYQQAAPIVMQTLMAAIATEQVSNADRKAA
ncbi:hypothetical protein SH528x_006533 [Novipirellula sp. SH528]|uniref:hypothetical protein n=1 Tax=Novipirellula sp. SH528 TaxID=3454466 RepID=UPI003FA0F350